MDITTALNLCAELWGRLVKDYRYLRDRHDEMFFAKEEVLESMGHRDILNCCPICEYVEKYANVKVMSDEDCLEQCPLRDLWGEFACEEVHTTAYTLARTYWEGDNEKEFKKKARLIIKESKRMLKEDF